MSAPTLVNWVTKPLLIPGRRSTCVPHAANPPPPPPPKNNKPKTPSRGFFADTDPSLEVLPVRRSLQQDVTKRGGRWQSDFIWNSNWQEQLDFEDTLRKQQALGKKEAAEGNTNAEGFLSLTSKIDLDSMDVDLSQQLAPRPPQQQSSPQQRKRGPKPATAPKRRGAATFAAIPATRGEIRSWDRSGKYSTKVVPVPIAATEDEEAEIAAAAAAEIAEYERLKAELQTWATALTAVCFGATFAFYGRDIAASYGIGALAGLFYLRLLNRSVDGVGGGLGAAIGQNRLLIPIILALGYNRYNTLAAESVGLQLQLLPMLVGFFTYKGAVVGRQGLTLFAELAAQPQGKSRGSEEAGGVSGEGAVSVERAFRN